MKPTKAPLAVLFAASLAALPACAAGPAAAPHTELKDCVIQEVLPGKNMTGAFLRFVHTGAPVDLVRAEVPGVSPRIELHSMTMKDGVMEMGKMTDLTLKAGERLFKKGGDHVMLFDIAQKPRVGSRHTLTVHFSDDTQASCQALVKSLHDLMREAGIGQAPAHDHGRGHGGDHGHTH